VRLFFPLIVVSLLGCRKVEPPVSVTPRATECGVAEDGSRSFKILHLNDIYRIEGLADGRGGLARVRTLRKELERDCPDAVLVTHAGDALFPSLLSRKFAGEQMVDVLNRLDGATGVFDDRFYFTIGNHEFDKAKLADAAWLQARIDQSEFTWFDTNIAWKDDGNAPLIAAGHLRSNAVVDVGGVQVGLFGLTTDAKVPEYVGYIDTDYASTARTQASDLRDLGAEVVIGLTHIDARDDVAILDQLGHVGPDLILGGHDHSLQTTWVGSRPVIKGDADAARIRVVHVSVHPDGRVSVRPDGGELTLGPDVPVQDPELLTHIQDWVAKFEKAFCADDGPDCLNEIYVPAGTDLHAEETRIRRFETNFGGWIADQMREVFAEHGAQVALINSGALRLNQDIQRGTPLTRQVLEELFAFPTRMSLIEISGRTLREVIDRSVRDWSGKGHWLQVSGIAFRHDAFGETASDLAIEENGRWVPLDPNKTYRVVTVRYLLDPSMGDQDGYRMLSLKQVVRTKQDGTDLKPIVAEAWKAMPARPGFFPKDPGRICNPVTGGRCVLDE
jgi:2',3'-cyclic-nucleotide 2'-phosphodiesterase (5'-nucleotidase family)